MKAKCVDDLLVYQKAIRVSAEVAKILERESFSRNLRLREQLAAAGERVASSIAEGFEMSTDRHFAQYCYRAKGSSEEARTQLTLAAQRHHITDAECVRISADFKEIARMLGGLIKHLERDDRRHR